MSSTSSTGARCPSCGAAATGHFCADCGAAVDGANCANCRAALSPGARFCHRCGTPAGATAGSAGATASVTSAPASTNALPWAFAAIALLAFAAYVAAQRFGAVSVPGANASVATAPAASGQPGAPFASGGMQPSAGDISALSPEEQADRLHDRMMRLYEQGKADSVQFFAPMAISAFQMLPVLDEHRRYDLGRIAEVSGSMPMARAQADTILSINPDHLLGLILASRIAELAGREADLAGYTSRLLQAADAELERNPVEYQLHATDINIALAESRRR